MSMELELQAEDAFDLEVEVDQVDPGDGWYINQITLKITCDDDNKVIVKVGRFHDSLSQLTTELEAAAKQARLLLDQWQDLPDESDAFVSDDRGAYFVRIEGVSYGDGRRGFPRKDIAIYELAAAMTESGVFPACWFQDERGGIDSIEEQVRAFHDEGGTDLKPLPGVVFAHDDAVMVDGWKAYIIKDWGDLGLTYVLAGDDTVHFSEDHSEFTPFDEDEEDS